MIHKTEGIVLKTIKHQDQNLITTLFTREYGLQSFLLSGFRTAKSRKTHSFFQPLSIVQIVYRERPNRGLHKITETQMAEMLFEVQTHPVKMSLGLTLVEIFGDTVQEEGPNLPLYEGFREVILALDRRDQRLIQIFLYYLIQHTRYLGFYPNDRTEGSRKVRFDIQGGTLWQGIEEDSVAALFRRFMYTDLSELPDPNSCQQLTFPGLLKRQLIRLIFDYYQYHLAGFKYPQTMKVFAELFQDG
ncbi:DNA repair protein RecO [Pontibacter sp. G13]|uniref:DNA repair protein RecO n=1 Tax=Pontibacter sp. G13 TaxID=3074898 RepID=UPI00288A5EE7|nr:DNA repair protein RecO [Pontibacter sp. G13]WNJ21435.1 DNA repair protein RecO [Pontibacter sp. G13]